MDNLVKLLKDSPIFIPKILLANYKSLGITESELIVIIDIMSYGNKVVYNPEIFANDLSDNKKNIMIIIDELCNKNILSIDIQKENNKTQEYISLDLLYEKLANIIIDNVQDKIIDTSIFTIFENELGRTLSPMEYEKIKEWINSGHSEELIACALKEAVLNGVSNFNYIDRILDNWKKKGYKNKTDINKDKENYRNNKEKVEVFETDWLNE